MTNEQEATKQHTPGPWTRRGDGFGIFAGGECIASVYPVEDEREAERVANAKLVAASPALLTAAKAARFALLNRDKATGLSDEQAVWMAAAVAAQEQVSAAIEATS